ncbi:MAG: glycine cleavage system protein GcvH [Pseudomonadota bacterium]
MSDIYYTSDHEWVKIDGDTAIVGITDYAQDQLGDIVFVELPEVDDQLSKGDEAGVIESVKVASEIYAPISGKITEINDALETDPTIVNKNAQDQGWLFKITVDNKDELNELMDLESYKAQINS